MSGKDEDLQLIDLDNIYKMLFHEEKYIVEFAEASIQSFSEFSDHYSRYVINRDMDNLKKAGHKMKPVAQMLGLKQITEEYENTKQHLEDAQTQELKNSVQRIRDICDRVISEFTIIIDRLQKSQNSR